MNLISVIMPAKNVGPFVAAAIISVLQQTGIDLELIVIDDGSKDNTMAEVRRVSDRRVRIVTGPGQGYAAAVNAGIAEAKGCYLAECDGDDLMPADRLHRQSQFLDEHPEYDAVCGYFSSMDREGRYLSDLAYTNTAEEITQELRNGVTRTSLCTYMLRTDVVRTVGGLRTYFRTGADVDFMLRVGERSRIWYEPMLCYQYRLHDGSLTHTQASQVNAFYEEIARQFQQQRLSGRQDDLERGGPVTPPPADSGHVLSAREHAQYHLIAQAWTANRDRRHRDAILLGLRACLARPGNPKAWKSLAALILIAVRVKPPVEGTKNTETQL